MNNLTIDGKSYAKMLTSGAAMLSAHVEELNALNVFPVADGDTGTNMLKTVEGGLAEISKYNGDSIGELSSGFARGVLLGARGNSGVILSQIFAGINERLQGYSSVTASQLAEAFRGGIARSYAAVQNPTEGTILTVFRESTEYAAEKVTAESTVEEFFTLHIKEARRSLEATKDILPALAEADVVDSGAAGYLCIAEGMYKALTGEELAYNATASKDSAQIDIDSFTRDSVLEFGYCTEFLLRLMSAKVDPDAFEVDTILNILTEMGGESIVAYKQDDIVKVHVHTFNPGMIMARMQEFGEFLTVKIENMSVGHSESTVKKPKSRKKLSVVAVATGEGLTALFKSMGADVIVSGGQTSNPSIEELVEAFKLCESEDIIVLPNNKNIILAAKQAAEIYTDARVHVMNSKSLMQGYSALSVITPGITDTEALLESIQRAIAGVVDGEITAAVRDVTIDGREIHTGDYMAISGGRIVVIAPTAEEAAMGMLSEADTDLCEIITLVVGKTVSEERRAALTEMLKDTYEDCEITVYDGGQDVYDYLISIE